MSRKFEELKSWCAEKTENGEKPLALARRICHRQLGDPKHPLNGHELAEIILALLDKGLNKNKKQEVTPHPKREQWKKEFEDKRAAKRIERYMDECNKTEGPVKEK